jgi:internalin A
MKHKLWVGILIGLILGIVVVSSLIIMKQEAVKVVNFPDKNLEREIRYAIRKPIGPIHVADLEKLTQLHANEESIADLTGLEYCTNLRVLMLGGNQISDLFALSQLTNLKRLWLCDNQISNISTLSQLTNLEELNLASNQIRDIPPLSRLTNLWNLRLEHNQISNINPLADNSGLSERGWVNLWDNPLSSASINVYIPRLEKRGVWCFS